MKSLQQYISEGRVVNEVEVKDASTNKLLAPVLWAYDKESLDKLVDKYKNYSEYWEDKTIHLTSSKNKSTWTVDSQEEFKFKVYQQSADFFYSDNISYTKDELLKILDEGNAMIIVIMKKD